MSTHLPDDLGGAIGRFRDLRRRFEQAIPAAAVSMDGRSFSYQIAIGSTVPPAGWLRGPRRRRRAPTRPADHAGARDARRPRGRRLPRRARACPATALSTSRPGAGARRRGNRGRALGRRRPVRRRPDRGRDRSRGRGALATATRHDGARDRDGARGPGRDGAGPDRRRRLRSAHVPLRPVGLRQDVLARRRPRAAPARHRAARRRDRPELRFRAPPRGARRRRPCARSTTRRLAPSILVRSPTAGERAGFGSASRSSTAPRTRASSSSTRSAIPTSTTSCCARSRKGRARGLPGDRVGAADRRARGSTG